MGNALPKLSATLVASLKKLQQKERRYRVLVPLLVLLLYRVHPAQALDKSRKKTGFKSSSCLYFEKLAL